MSYDQVVSQVLQESGVELSTMMKTPCLRYKGEFLAMMFDKEAALIIKVSAGRVKELIKEGVEKKLILPKSILKSGR